MATLSHLYIQDVEGIKRTLSRHKAEIKRKFKVKTVGVFGSYVRGEQESCSDVDILVEFEKPVGLFEFMALENHLSDLIGVKVDLFSKKPFLLTLADASSKKLSWFERT